MALILRQRVVWTGVAGAPFYSNFYAVNGDVDAISFHTAVTALCNSLAGKIRRDLTGTVESDVPLIDSVTGEIQGIDSVAVSSIDCLDEQEPLPTATQVLVRLKTNAFIGGRRLQGRFFMPGITQYFNVDGVPDVAAATAVETSFSAYLTTMEGFACVWSRKTGAVAPISDINVWNQFAVLRSRRD